MLMDCGKAFCKIPGVLYLSMGSFLGLMKLAALYSSVTHPNLSLKGYRSFYIFLIFIHSIIHLFNDYLLTFFNVLDTEHHARNFRIKNAVF